MTCHCRFRVLDFFVVSYAARTRSACSIFARIAGFIGFSHDSGASSEYRATEMVRYWNTFLFYVYL